MKTVLVHSLFKNIPRYLTWGIIAISLIVIRISQLIIAYIILFVTVEVVAPCLAQALHPQLWPVQSPYCSGDFLSIVVALKTLSVFKLIFSYVYHFFIFLISHIISSLCACLQDSLIVIECMLVASCVQKCFNLCINISNFWSMLLIYPSEGQHFHNQSQDQDKTEIFSYHFQCSFRAITCGESRKCQASINGICSSSAWCEHVWTRLWKIGPFGSLPHSPGLQTSGQVRITVSTKKRLEILGASTGLYNAIEYKYELGDKALLAVT